jgi:hypothetical protein
VVGRHGEAVAGVNSRSSFSTIINLNGVGGTGGDDAVFCDGIVTGGVGGFLELRGPEAAARDARNAVIEGSSWITKWPP